MSQIPELRLDAGLPSNTDAERTILGAILLDNKSFMEASEKLEACEFSLESHARIFLRMSELMAASRSVDIVTLANELSKHKEVETIGGVAYLASLTEGLPRRPVIEEYIRIVKDKSLLRKLMRISSMAIARAADQSDSAMDIIGAVSEQIQQAAEQGISSPLQTFDSFVSQAYPSIDAFFRQSARSLGLPSGIKELDALTCGFQRKDLIILAARPSMGKSDLAITLGAHAAIELDQTVAFFSLEMSKQSVFHRLISQRSTVSRQDMREGRWTDTNKRYATEAMAEIVGAPFYIDDFDKEGAPTLHKMHGKAARLKANTGHLDLIIIDLLGKIKPPDEGKRYGNRSFDLGLITAGLKWTAKSLDVPVILLHHLSRETEKRDTKVPRLSDLRESGNIEQDADMVIFPHRPSYYEKSSSEKENRKAKIIVSKQRDGATGEAECEYLIDTGVWRDEEERESLWGK